MPSTTRLRCLALRRRVIIRCQGRDGQEEKEEEEIGIICGADLEAKIHLLVECTQATNSREQSETTARRTPVQLWHEKCLQNCTVFHLAITTTSREERMRVASQRRLAK